MNIAPAFRVLANDQDISDRIRERFVSLSFTDETGTASDILSITLADHLADAALPVPPVGAELELFLGYDDRLQRMGLFICDEVQLSGMPGSMVIRARAAPFEASKRGKTDLQTQKTRTWKKGTTLGTMVARIAAEHGLRARVSPALASVALPQTVQSSESDMNLLLRLALRHDAVAKPAGGVLLFLQRGDLTTAEGTPLENTVVTPGQGNSYQVTFAARKNAGTTIAYYRDTQKAQRREVAVGQGDPVIRLRMAAADAQAARAMALSAHQARARDKKTLKFSMGGDPNLRAESMLVLKDFREGVDGGWLVKKVTHTLDQNGYVSAIECEQPNSAEEVKRARAAPVQDRIQGVEEIG